MVSRVAGVYQETEIKAAAERQIKSVVLGIMRLRCISEIGRRELCVESSRRFFYKLSEYKRVNSVGRHLNNIGIPEGVKDKTAFTKKHQFSIAFENVRHRGYCTEKIVQAFAAGTIPIYWGDPMVSTIFNPKAFINCNDYDSFDEVIETVKEIDRDRDGYLEMIRTPALLNSNIREEMLKKFTDFLYNIFDQDMEDAYRRDTIGYGKMHCDDIKNIRS